MKKSILALILIFILTACSGGNTEFKQDTMTIVDSLTASIESGDFNQEHINKLELYSDEWDNLKSDKLSDNEKQVVNIVLGMGVIAQLYPSETDSDKKSEYRQSFIKYKDDIESMIGK